MLSKHQTGGWSYWPSTGNLVPRVDSRKKRMSTLEYVMVHPIYELGYVIIICGWFEVGQ